MTESWGSDTELPAVLVEKMTTYRKMYADILDMVTEIDNARIAEHAGYPSLAVLLGHLPHLNTSDARRMVTQAEQVTESVTPTGHVRLAGLPTVRQVLHKGDLGPRHLDAVTETVARLPVWGHHRAPRDRRIDLGGDGPYAGAAGGARARADLAGPHRPGLHPTHPTTTAMTATSPTPPTCSATSGFAVVA